MKIKVKWLIEFQIYFVLIVEALISLFHFPSTIRFLLDLNTLLIIAAIIINFRKIEISGRLKGYLKYIIIFLICIFVLAMLHLVPIGQFIWAIRNNYFFLFFSLICVYCLKESDIKRILKIVVLLQYFNIFCAFYEYFILNVQNDFLGGMFGCEQGCNAYLNAYLSIITAICICQFIYKKTSLFNMLFIVGSSSVIATLGELKIYYIELILIVIFAVLLSKKSIKSFFIVITCFCSLIIGIKILSQTSNESLQFIQSIDSLIEYDSRTDYGDGDIRISRFTVFNQVNDYFFNDNTYLKMFGFGLGSCEDSETFSGFNSDFANKFGFLQYRNLSSSMLYLEVGWFGLIGFIFIFMYIFILSYKYKRNFIGTEYVYLPILTQIVCVLTIIGIFYNSAIRREIAYFTYFILSLNLILIKEKKFC
ncbi:hypothetical protein ACQR2U_11980 [Clostridium perfringens]|nr:hypothetical protein [Clostridium perfringens]